MPPKQPIAVRTASALQVRKQVYTGSNAAWRAHHALMPEWFDALSALDRDFRAHLAG